MKIIYISGGQRSGKSSFAQAQAEGIHKAPIYLATARILDDEFQKRVDRHKQNRNDSWTTIEIPDKISMISEYLTTDSSVIVLDCITLWLTNYLLDNGEDLDLVLKLAKEEWDRFRALPGTCFVISNETGMGLVSEHLLGRLFVDLQGFMNQYIASIADEAYFMVSGIPLRTK